MSPVEAIDSLPARLRWARETAGLSKRALSDLAGLDPSHVRLIESGDRLDPRVDTLGGIARVLGTTVDWLAFGNGAAPSADDVTNAVGRARATRPPPDVDELPATGTEG